MATEPRRITFLIMPPADFPLWKARLSLRFALFCLGAWTILTICSGFMLGSGVDYAMMKADNEVMRARMTFMVSEIERSRADMTSAKEADQKLRAMLGMPNREAILQGRGGVGGPAVQDQRRLLQEFLRAPARGNPAVMHRDIVALRSESRQRVASFQEIARGIDLKKSLYRATPLGWPAAGRKSSGFGYRFSPFSRDDDSEAREFHPGQDIAADAGSPIRATADGVVRRAGFTRGYGLMVLLNHDFGYATLFGHASRLLVKEGQKVVRGQVIALVGSTGRSTGPHVHYEVWRGGKRVNPLPFMASRASN